MDKEIIFLIEESSEGGYTARALGFSIYTEAENLEDIKVKIIDAVKCHFKQEELPHILRFHMVKDEVVTI